MAPVAHASAASLHAFVRDCAAPGTRVVPTAGRLNAGWRRSVHPRTAQPGGRPDPWRRPLRTPDEFVFGFNRRRLRSRGLPADDPRSRLAIASPGDGRVELVVRPPLPRGSWRPTVVSGFCRQPLATVCLL